MAGMVRKGQKQIAPAPAPRTAQPPARAARKPTATAGSPPVLRGVLIESVPLASNAAQRALVQKAVAELARERGLWDVLPPQAFVMGLRHVEVRASFDANGQVVGLSRNERHSDGSYSRALVIAPRYQGSAASHEVSLLELASLFERGAATAVHYATRVDLDSDRVAARLQRLGAVASGQGLGGRYRRWRLTPAAFAARKDAGMRIALAAAELGRPVAEVERAEREQAAREQAAREQAKRDKQAAAELQAEQEQAEQAEQEEAERAKTDPPPKTHKRRR